MFCMHVSELKMCFSKILMFMSKESSIEFYTNIYTSTIIWLTFKNKSALYWPESISKKLVKGKFIVRLVNEKTYANFAVRQLKIDNKEVSN